MFMFKNIAIYRQNGKVPSSFPGFWSSENLGSFAGNMAYAFELASQFMSVRLTAKRSVNFQYLCYFGLIGIGILYYINALTFQMAFPKSELEEKDSFTLYSNPEWLWHSHLIYLFIPLSFYYFVMNSIMSAEIFETLPQVKAFVEPVEGTVDRPKLVFIRCSIWLTAISITFLTENIVTVLNIVGSIFSPFISNIIPVA
jgi:energy-coupling factor transporter transmembrane protein EcfT